MHYSPWPPKPFTFLVREVLLPADAAQLIGFSKLVVLQFETVTGSTFIEMSPDTAKNLADALLAKSTGLVIGRTAT